MKFVKILDSNCENVYLNINHIIYIKDYVDKHDNDEINTLISLIDGTEINTNESAQNLYNHISFIINENKDI
jgi:glycerol-3-phosphate responsive antiterminator